MKTSEDISEKIKSIIKDSIIEFGDLRVICEKIKEKVDSEFDGLWFCQALYNPIGFNDIKINSNFAVEINFGKLSITVAKPYDKVRFKKKLHQ
jgi:hypothetical protein